MDEPAAAAQVKTDLECAALVNFDSILGFPHSWPSQFNNGLLQSPVSILFDVHEQDLILLQKLLAVRIAAIPVEKLSDCRLMRFLL
jgi:hypothetical protein